MLLAAFLIGSTGFLLLSWWTGLQQVPRFRKPGFLRPRTVWLGLPAAGLLLAGIGFAWMISLHPLAGVLTLVLEGLLGLLLWKHDQYSAQARILHGTYQQIRESNQEAEEFDCLYALVSTRTPRWSEDRRVELCAGKNLRQLILVILLLENKIHPLEDAALYAQIKRKVERIVPLRKGSRP